MFMRGICRYMAARTNSTVCVLLPASPEVKPSPEASSPPSSSGKHGTERIEINSNATGRGQGLNSSNPADSHALYTRSWFMVTLTSQQVNNTHTHRHGWTGDDTPVSGTGRPIRSSSACQFGAHSDHFPSAARLSGSSGAPRFFHNAQLAW